MGDIKHRHTKAGGKKKNGLLLILLLLLLVGIGGYVAWRVSQPAYSDRLEPNAVVGSMPGNPRNKSKRN